MIFVGTRIAYRYVLVLRERQVERKTTEKTTSGGNTPSFSSPVHRPGPKRRRVSPSFQRGGGLSHTNTVFFFFFSSSPFFSFFVCDRVYLFCGVASGRLGLTQPPSTRSCAHAGRETLLHRLLFTKSPVPFPPWLTHRCFVCFARRVKSTPCDAPGKRKETGKPGPEEEDNRVILYDQHYQRPIP